MYYIITAHGPSVHFDTENNVKRSSSRPYSISTSNDEMTTESGVNIRSLTELDVLLSTEVHDHLSAPYEVLYSNKEVDDKCVAAARHLDDVLRA
jgi:hypothetical protein